MRVSDDRPAQWSARGWVEWLRLDREDRIMASWAETLYAVVG